MNDACEELYRAMVLMIFKRI